MSYRAEKEGFPSATRPPQSVSPLVLAKAAVCPFNKRPAPPPKPPPLAGRSRAPDPRHRTPELRPADPRVSGQTREARKRRGEGGGGGEGQRKEGLWAGLSAGLCVGASKRVRRSGGRRGSGVDGGTGEWASEASGQGARRSEARERARLENTCGAPTPGSHRSQRGRPKRTGASLSGGKEALRGDVALARQERTGPTRVHLLSTRGSTCRRSKSQTKGRPRGTWRAGESTVGVHGTDAATMSAEEGNSLRPHPPASRVFTPPAFVAPPSLPRIGKG